MSERVKSAAGSTVRALPDGPRAVVARGGDWLRRQATFGVPAEGIPAQAVIPLIDTSRPLPLPAGVTEEELRRSFATWSIDGEAAGHMNPYVADSFQRFVHTYGLVSNLSGTCLELGANPYFTTHLLEEHSDLELEMANYFDGSSEFVTQTLSYVAISGTHEEKELTSRQFNVEGDEFPYPDGSMDVVLFCEIIEHLLMNPIDVLREISRVLAEDGVLVVTTPNVGRLENFLRLLNGDNIYDPYSGYGPYGRHNREYTLDELVFLLDFMGFDMEETFVTDGHPVDLRGHPSYVRVAPLVADRQDRLGGYLFVRARKTRPAREGLPSNLFRSWPSSELVDP